MAAPAPCDHPVHVARADVLDCARRVAVGQLTIKEIGNGGYADMRVGPDIGVLGQARGQNKRTHVIEKNERANHPPRGCPALC